MSASEETMDMFLLDVASKATSRPDDTMPLWMVVSLLRLTANLSKDEAGQKKVEHVLGPIPQITTVVKPQAALPAPKTPWEQHKEESREQNKVVVEVPPYDDDRGGIATDVRRMVVYFEGDRKLLMTEMGLEDVLSIFKGTIGVMATMLERLSVSPVDRGTLVNVQQMFEQMTLKIDREAENVHSVEIRANVRKGPKTMAEIPAPRNFDEPAPVVPRIVTEAGATKKRVWSDEQRAAAAERMRKRMAKVTPAQRAEWGKKGAEVRTNGLHDIHSDDGANGSDEPSVTTVE